MRSDLKIGIIVGVLLVVGGVIFLVSRTGGPDETEATLQETQNPVESTEPEPTPAPQTTTPPVEPPPVAGQQQDPPVEQQQTPPATAEQTTPPPVEDLQDQRQPRYYVVKEGDSLARIARSYFADEKFDSVIQVANKELIKDKNMLQPGWRLRIPYPDDADQIWQSIK